MLYQFMTLDDGTEIVQSEAIEDKGKEKVIEKLELDYAAVQARVNKLLKK